MEKNSGCLLVKGMSTYPITCKKLKKIDWWVAPMKTESNFCMYIIIKSMRGSVTPLIKKKRFQLYNYFVSVFEITSLSPLH